MLTKNEPFMGRKAELAALRQFFRKKTASFVVIRGRRRIGKSRLIEEFARGEKFYTFAGLPPTSYSTAQSERDIFAAQLAEQTGLPEVKADDWSKLFSLLFEKIKTGRIILLFDEISWMGTHDPDFLGKIKNAWDQKFKKNPRLIFVVCGSASAWIEKNILNSTGFLGRISYTLTLTELPLADCVKFWNDAYHHISAYEKLKLLSVTGGIPKYLEEIDPAKNAEENISDLCFRKGGFLVEEFDHIFSNMFQRRTPLYCEIVKSLMVAPKEASEICAELNVEMTGLFSEYLEELLLCGFIQRDYTWDIKTGQDSRLSRYRLSDNYLRFYLRYIQKYKSKIERSAFLFKSISALPEWQIILGLQFENLVLNNRCDIQAILNIKPEDIISDNPYFQRKTSKQLGCQVDYMIQTKFNTLYICEIKFSKNPIGAHAIPELQQKIARLSLPKGFSCRPVLIHVNGITEDLIEKDYFAATINVGKLLG